MRSEVPNAETEIGRCCAQVSDAALEWMTNDQKQICWDVSNRVNGAICSVVYISISPTGVSL